MENPVVTIEMENGGIITAELYPDVAPQSVYNFISLANSGFYDGLIFHRVKRECIFCHLLTFLKYSRNSLSECYFHGNFLFIGFLYFQDWIFYKEPQRFVQIADGIPQIPIL